MTSLDKVSIAITMLGAAAVLVSFVAERHVKLQALRRSVFCNLDSAADNGYFAPGGELWGATADEIAQDLALYAVDFEGNYYTSDIAPYVREWRTKRLRTGDTYTPREQRA